MMTCLDMGLFNFCSKYVQFLPPALSSIISDITLESKFQYWVYMTIIMTLSMQMNLCITFNVPGKELPVALYGMCADKYNSVPITIN